jgi:hypothetical protein
MASPVKTVKYLVASTISQNKKFGASTADYSWLEEILISFMSSQFRTHDFKGVKTVYADINYSSRSWHYPSDYMIWSKISMRHKTRTYTLGLNPNLYIGSDNAPVCESLEQAIATNGGGYSFALASEIEAYVDGLPTLSLGGGTSVNYFREDDENRRIVFENNLQPGTVVIEYVTNGGEITGDSLFPLIHEDLLRKYLIWQYYKLSPELIKLAASAEREFRDARYDTNLLLSPGPDEYNRRIQESLGFNLG